MSSGIERERRFIVDGRGDKPWREHGRAITIQQHYLPTESIILQDKTLFYEGQEITALSDEDAGLFAEHSDWVVRLRQWDEAHIISAKSKISDEAAFEIEQHIGASAARTILSDGPFPSVQKTRYLWTSEEEYLWEIDEYEEALAGLILAEVEFGDAQEVTIIPAWCSLEVTNIPSWSNASLAKMLS